MTTDRLLKSIMTVAVGLFVVSVVAGFVLTFLIGFGVMGK